MKNQTIMKIKSAWLVITDESDGESDDENDILIGCLRGDIVGIQYYKGMVMTSLHLL